MSQRWFAAAGVVLAGAFGIFTCTRTSLASPFSQPTKLTYIAAYSTLQPELQRIQEEREHGDFNEKHGDARAVQARPNQDGVISQAILSDIREARDSVSQVSKGGFAWGIRQWIQEKKSSNDTTDASKESGKTKD